MQTEGIEGIKLLNSFERVIEEHLDKRSLESILDEEKNLLFSMDTLNQILSGTSYVTPDVITRTLQQIQQLKCELAIIKMKKIFASLLNEIKMAKA